MTRAYEELGGGLQHLYLEDSYLLGFRADASRLVLIVDAVQVEASPYQESPAPGEQYCYREVDIVFANTTSIDWITCGFRPSFGADGSIDFDNIDTFEEEQPGVYRLSGGWGEVVIQSDPPSVDFRG